MEIKELQHVEVITDVLCDVCGQSTQLNYGELKAPNGVIAQRMMVKSIGFNSVRHVFRILRIIKKEKLDSVKSNANQF